MDQQNGTKRDLQVSPWDRYMDRRAPKRNAALLQLGLAFVVAAGIVATRELPVSKVAAAIVLVVSFGAVATFIWRAGRH